MRINHNIPSLNNYRQLTANSANTMKSLEKLSSGLRINKAADDAAGLAISEKMKGQIRGLSQASRNAQDAISLIQTAEGAASSVHNMLQRARELSIQSSTGTLTDTDRSALNDEMKQIKSQIDTVADTTEFNTQKMLNQGSSLDMVLNGVSQSTIDELKNKVPLWIDDALSAIGTNLDIAFPALRNMTVKLYQDASETRAAYMGTSDGGATLELGLNLAKLLDSNNLVPSDASGGQFDTVIAHEIVHAMQFTAMPGLMAGGFTSDEMWFVEGLATAVQGGNGFISPPNNAATVNLGAWTGTSAEYGSAFAAVKALHEITVGGIDAVIDRLEAGDTMDQALNSTTQQVQGEITAGVGAPVDFATAADFINWFNTSAKVDNYLDTSNDFLVGTGAITNAATAGSSHGGDQASTIANNGAVDNAGVYNIIFADISSGGVDPQAQTLSYQIGANTGQSIEMQTVNISTTGLGLTSLDISTQQNAKQAIATIDKAISRVSTVRSNFGALQNRLEHTIKNLSNTEENLTASESRIRDVDMAKEMMAFTKDNILTQAAQAMMSQANQQPQAVLQLLR